MKTVCKEEQCAGCMACVDICPKGAISIKDNLQCYNAVINEELCVNCDACQKVCQSNHPASTVAPIFWQQGWTLQDEVRAKSSSGGAAAELSRAFVASGGIVCSCVFRNGVFGFEFAETVDQLQKFVGSKYVKSNPVGIYKQISDKLKQEKKVLFIGLPCQVSALKNFVLSKYQKNLYTVDLICHGTPSPEILEKFLNQHHYSLKNLKDICFRMKAKFQVFEDYKGIVTPGVSDRYTIAFLNGLTYTENCYSCQYAKRERVSDLTIGDSWGNELETEEQEKGISLILCQTEKGTELLNNARLHLESVDVDRAVMNNHQLHAPSNMPEGRYAFFHLLNEGKNFDSLVKKNFPKQCFRQDVKKILIKAKIIGGRTGKMTYGITVLEGEEKLQ